MEWFNSFSPDAKVWIYASSRILTNSESTELQSAVNSFTQSWTAHQQTLKAQAYVYDKLFLVFAVDETEHTISGCGIDKSVAFVKEAAQIYGVDFFNRLQIEVKMANEWHIASIAEIGSLIQNNKLTMNDLFADKTLTTLAQLRQYFTKPIHQSWFANRINRFSSPQSIA